MKHISSISFEGDKEYSNKVGYNKELDIYIYRKYVSYAIGYYKYYRVTKEEAEVLKKTNDISALILDYEKSRLIGVGYRRGYDITHDLPKGLNPYAYYDGPFLYDGEIFYYHLFWEGKHYAAIPYCQLIDENLVRYYPFRDMQGVSEIHVNYNGEDLLLCYGKEVDDFEGLDEWQKLYLDSQREID